MLIMPKKGYRVCLHCGKILLSRQILKMNKEGKVNNVCPYCYTPESTVLKDDLLDEVKAHDLFEIVSLKTKEFCLTPELENKYNKMYDNCLIPKSVRV